MKWQPIETAPGRGEYIVYQPEHKGGRIILPARICMSSDAGHHRNTTHWMPLPEPPEGDE